MLVIVDIINPSNTMIPRECDAAFMYVWSNANFAYKKITQNNHD